MAKKNFVTAFGDEPPVSAGTTLSQAAALPTPAEELRYDYAQLDETVRELVLADVRIIKGEERNLRSSIYRIGQALDSIRGAVRYGQFEDLCRTEFDLSLRQAENWMNVSRQFLPHQIELFSDTGALYLLAGPRVPQEVRDTVIQAAVDTGEKINRKTARATIDTAKRSSGGGGSGGAYAGNANFVPVEIDGTATIVDAGQTHSADLAIADGFAQQIRQLIAAAGVNGHLAVLDVMLNHTRPYFYEETGDIYLHDKSGDIIKAMRDRLLE